jgi:hypothetical protein
LAVFVWRKGRYAKNPACEQVALVECNQGHPFNGAGRSQPAAQSNEPPHARLLVEVRAPTLRDPTFGDYVFVQNFNSANEFSG